MKKSSSQIVSLLERLGRMTRGIQHAEGLKPAQWEALRFLSRANKTSRNPGALADFLSSTRGTVSQTLITLEKKGLINRRANPGDGRGKFLDLTDRGQATVARDPLAMIEAAVAKATNANSEGGSLESGLQSVLHQVTTQNGAPSFGKCDGCVHFQKYGAVDDDLGPHRCGELGSSISETEQDQICRTHQAQTAA
ncbi:MAG TPA: MarR family transcriptional regulator [Rhodospirillales bacterium]|nr:MarR family transcriptional regulator [Rhodospirillales bacterium]